MATILIPIPDAGFDPTEVAVPSKIWRQLGYTLVFATPGGTQGAADPRMVTGEDLGLLAPVLRANADGQQAYRELQQCSEFARPVAYTDFESIAADALFLPGGHAQGMKPYLESERLQAQVVRMFESGRPVGAICHGVLVAARSRGADGRSVLFGRKTTALTRSMELTAWSLTRAWLGDYYRTYPQTVEDEVAQALARPEDFIAGPTSLLRDSAARPERGFTVRDGAWLSARWPGDAHRFAAEFAQMLPKASA
jgi:protease I